MTHQFQHPDVFYVGEMVDENEMRVTCLGSGMPYTRRAQAAASWLVELGNGDIFIFDLGTGATANLNAFQIPYNKLTKIFLTHLHVDHWGDLSALFAIGMVFGRTELTEVWGPSGKEEKFGTAAFGKAFEQSLAWDIGSRQGKTACGEYGDKIVFHEFDYSKPLQTVFEQNGVKISACPAVHAIDGPVSYRLDWNGLSFAFSGDTKPNQFFVDMAKGADMVVHETFLPATAFARKTHLPLPVASNVVNGVHTPPRSAGKVFDLTKPKLAVMYHLMLDQDVIVETLEDLRVTYDGPVAIAIDNMVFNINNDGVVQRRGVVSDFPWPVPSTSHDESVDASAVIPISKWLAESEIPVEGIDTDLKA